MYDVQYRTMAITYIYLITKYLIKFDVQKSRIRRCSVQSTVWTTTNHNEMLI